MFDSTRFKSINNGQENLTSTSKFTMRRTGSEKKGAEFAKKQNIALEEFAG
jgi:hypothetical protein